MTVSDPQAVSPGGRRAWVIFVQALGPPIVLGGALVASVALAWAIRNQATWLLERAVAVAGWATDVWNYVLPDLQKPQLPKDYATKISLGTGAFGAAVMLTTVKDIAGVIGELLGRWGRLAVGDAFSAFSKITVVATALWLSVHGLEALVEAGKSQRLTIDAALMPPVTFDPGSGRLVFYVGFYEEAGKETFTEGATHKSIHVSDSDKDFLGRLKNALNQCGSTSDPVKVRIDGFASGSQWTEVREYLTEVAGDDADTGKSTCSVSRDVATTLPGTARNAIACIDSYKEAQAKVQRGSRGTEDGAAFNVYLANLRRLEVATQLGIAPSPSGARVELTGEPWSHFSAMENSLVVDDSRMNNFQVAGLLTRSARITIDHPAGCNKAGDGVLSRTQLVLE